MAPKLYMVKGSPPVRAVRMMAEAINLELELETVNVLIGEQLKDNFLKLNPAHTVPTLVDDGFILWDSHAIMPYLVGKYAKDDFLYPKDLQKRAIVDQLLHFDSNVVFSNLKLIFKPLLYYGIKEIPEDSIALVFDAYKSLNTIIGKNDYVTGSKPTLADLSLIATISTLSLRVPIDKEKFPNVTGWMRKVEKLPYYGPNEKDLFDFNELLKAKLA